jgi:hypothetical protein
MTTLLLRAKRVISKKRPIAASNDGLRQPRKTATDSKPVSIKDVAFRTSFGLGPEKAENQGAKQRKNGWRMGRIDGSERCLGKM